MYKINNEYYFGHSDNPLQSSDSDIFDLRSDYKGFATFIRNAETPFTISIQGEWGIGKTSFMNLVEKELESLNMNKNSNDFKTEYIRYSAWTLSSIGGNDNLPLLFLNHFIETAFSNIEGKDQEIRNIKRKIQELYKRSLDKLFFQKMGT